MAERSPETEIQARRDEARVWAAGDGRLGTRNRELVYAVCEDVGQLLARVTDLEIITSAPRHEDVVRIYELEQQNRRLLAIAEAAERVRGGAFRHGGMFPYVHNGDSDAAEQLAALWAALVSLEADPQPESEDECEYPRPATEAGGRQKPPVEGAGRTPVCGKPVRTYIPVDHIPNWQITPCVLVDGHEGLCRDEHEREDTAPAQDGET